MNWEALRAEYVAGGIGQRALAQKHGAPLGELQRRAKAEGWTALRKAAAEARARNDAQIAERVRRKLLARLERMADEIPDGAVTEQKTQADSVVTLFKLRDLTAAFKELASDMPADGEDEDGVKVIIDV